jgi:hypothetical protein
MQALTFISLILALVILCAVIVHHIMRLVSRELTIRRSNALLRAFLATLPKGDQLV